MGSKSKSICHLGVLNVNNLRHSYLNLFKFENYVPTVERLNNNLLTLQMLNYLFFSLFVTLKKPKVQK